MLQKIYWLAHIQSEQIENTQEFRTLFCKHEFPYLTFLSPAFAMTRGGLVSNAHAWTLIIYNRSIFFGAGSSGTSVDDVSEQIRRLLILQMNLFFGQSPEEVERHCDRVRSVAGNLVPQQILPNVFNSTSKSLYEEVEALGTWFQKVLSLPRQKYQSVCKALAAYERSLHILSSDPALSYSVLVFAIEALANSHLDYQATWDDLRGEVRERFDILLADSRASSIDASWLEDLRKTLVDAIHPGATRRFVKFARDHIPSSLYDASNCTSKFPLRRSRIEQSIHNAYTLRSSFSHALTPLTTLLISESHRAEEIEQNGSAYLTLRGLFRLVRSIILEFIERQESEDLTSYPWDAELGHGVVHGLRWPAYARMKGTDGKFYQVEAQYAQNWFEDILQIYQDNYVERLHSKISADRANPDLLSGVAISGPWTGRFLFRYDPSPSYDWRSFKEQSLGLIAQAQKAQKEYLQAIALLCTHLEIMDGEEKTAWDDVIKTRSFGEPLLGLARFVIDVIHDKMQHWTGDKAENTFEKYLKKRKLALPTRVEVACMLELARLFKNEGSDEECRKWLNAAYGDTASYPSCQELIRCALDSGDIVVEPRKILSVPEEEVLSDEKE